MVISKWRCFKRTLEKFNDKNLKGAMRPPYARRQYPSDILAHAEPYLARASLYMLPLNSLPRLSARSLPGPSCCTRIPQHRDHMKRLSYVRKTRSNFSAHRSSVKVEAQWLRAVHVNNAVRMTTPECGGKSGKPI